MTTPLSLLFLLVACDPGGLYSAEQLAELGDLAPLPVEPAWEVRWYQGWGEGLELACGLIEAEIVEEELTGGVVWTEPPEPDELVDDAVWIEGDDFSWAVALFVLVDPTIYQPEDWVIGAADEDLEEGMDTEAILEASAGVWGGAGDRALLLGEGDLDLLAEEVTLTDDAWDALLEGGTWIGLQAQIAEVSEELEGSLYPLPEHEQEAFDHDGLRVQATDFLEESAVNVLSGEVVGGATTTCDR